MIKVLLGIGSNIEPEKNLLAGVAALKLLDPNCEFSRVFESEPVGFKGENVFNLVAQMHTELSLEKLLDKLKEIEINQGKMPNAKKFTDRTLDIDLLTYGELCQTKQPKLPREDIYKYAFVLLPLAELCPDSIIPGDKRTFLQAWKQFDEKQKLTPSTMFKFN